MLREILDVPQIAGQPRRRWFHDEFLDLVVWFRDSGEPLGFQLCYDLGQRERALTWIDGKGASHAGVDDGEHSGRPRKLTPVLVPNGPFDRGAIADRFRRAAAAIDPQLALWVESRLLEDPDIR